MSNNQKSISDEINRILKQISTIQEGKKYMLKKNKDYDNAKIIIRDNTTNK